MNMKNNLRYTFLSLLLCGMAFTACEDDVTVGMHATVMNGAVIGAGSMVAAGALVKERSVIPPCSLVVGVPGKVIRTLDAQTVARNIEHSQEAYIADAQEYARARMVG